MDVEPLTMTTEQAAARLGVTPDWLRRRAAAGLVPSRKIGAYRKFTEQDLIDYLESVRQGDASNAAVAGTRLSRARRRAS